MRAKMQTLFSISEGWNCLPLSCYGNSSTTLKRTKYQTKV